MRYDSFFRSQAPRRVAKIGWTDEAREAAAAARQHGYQENTPAGPGVARAYEHPDGHVLDIKGNGEWSHNSSAGVESQGKGAQQLHDHLDKTHNTVTVRLPGAEGVESGPNPSKPKTVVVPRTGIEN